MSDFTDGRSALLDGYDRAYKVFAPPPKVTVSQWSDRFRKLSTIDAAEPGQWDTSIAEYQRGIMDAFTDPLVEDIVLECSAQVGKTAIMLNCQGYIIDCDPGPVLMVLPTKDDAEEFSKDRFTEGLIEATPTLRGKVLDVKSGASKDKSTIQHKRFHGGRLTFAWANSGSRLSSRPIRYVFGDECDKWSPHPRQGDPMERSRKRTATFISNRKHMWASTPTLKDNSIIDDLYEKSSRGHYYVPCPGCGANGVIGFFKDSKGVLADSGFHIIWEKDAAGISRPETAAIVCHSCGAVITEGQKFEMVSKGFWFHEHPEAKAKGFHLSATISPWSTWAELVTKFLHAGTNTEKLRIFWNEELGEAWELRGEMISDSALMKRRERFPAVVPAGALVLTAGVDVQDNRLECKIKGWGLPQSSPESWDICYRVFPGDPNFPEVWADLDLFLHQEWEHESGVNLSVICTLVDSGGHRTKKVYDFCKTKQGRYIFPSIGRSNEGGKVKPIISKPTKHPSGCLLYTVGVDTAKEYIYRRLLIDRPGPGFHHFPMEDWCDDEYFAQLTAEKIVTKTKGFRTQKVWEKRRERNESLDTEVLALAALELRKVDLAAVHKNLGVRVQKKITPPEPPEVIVGDKPKPSAPPRRTPPRRSGGWVNAWRNY